MNDVSVASLLKQSNLFLEVIAKAHMRDVLASELKDPKKKKLYELTDGSKSVKELASATGMATGTISTTWQHWEECGMVIKAGRSYRRVFA